MTINIIAAVAENGVIGYQGGIPWKVKEDMKLFKETTVRNTVVMGRKTWESLPAKMRPLPYRQNIVVSRTLESSEVLVAKTLDDAISQASHENVFLIGGESIYSEGLEKADFLYISHIPLSPQGDVYFPVRNFDAFKCVEEKDFGTFMFKKYEIKR